VYREFDCYDPAARAPTPLPPMFLDEEEHHGESGGPVQPTNTVIKKRMDSHVETATPSSDSTLRSADYLPSIPYPEAPRSTDDVPLSKLRLTPPKSASKAHTPRKNAKPPKQQDDSPLSDIPSDISEWEEEKKVRLSTLKIFRHN